MTFSTRRYTRTYHSAGVPVPFGETTFQLSNEMTDDVNLTILPVLIQASIVNGQLIGPDGQAGVVLECNDDPTTSPPNSYYIVRELSQPPYKIIASTADAATTDLATKVAVTAGPPLGPAGPAGPQGPTGPVGPQGAAGVVQSVGAADSTIVAAGTASAPTLRANVGTAAGSVASGNDARFVSAATTVAGPAAYGAAAVVGAGVAFARDDHNHGLPAAPAAAGLTSGAVALGADIAVAINTAVTLVTSPSLAAGTYLVNGSLDWVNTTTATGNNPEVFVALGTAVGSLAGQVGAQVIAYNAYGTSQDSTAIACILTVTTAGTITLSFNSYTAPGTVKATTPSGAHPATALSWVKIA